MKTDNLLIASLKLGGSIVTFIIVMLIWFIFIIIANNNAADEPEKEIPKATPVQFN